MGTYDGATIRLYQDGALVQTATTTGVVAANSVAVGIGNRVAVNTGGRGWDGYIADVSIWKRALSPAEVLADYDLSQRGYPGVLRRNRPLSVCAGAALVPTGGVSGD
jgi:hypothetical protein